jgi:peptidoglycan/xylan/chitin deacetylase (PgdA/CDA1 family)
MNVSIRYFVRNSVYRLLRVISGPGKCVRVILLYHSVAKGPSFGSYSVPVKSFEAQMAYLSRHFKIVRLCDLEHYIATNYQDRIACVTFDDGCFDNYEVALPVLERFGIKATFFVVTGLLGGSLITSYGNVRLMGSNEIRELASLGHEIGAHSVSHLKLTQVPLERARKEIGDSKHFLEDLIGKEVISFAYPKGAWNETLKEEVRQQGFRYAVTIQEGLVSDHSDWLALPRVWISPSLSLGSFAAKLSPAVEWYEKLRRLRKRI